MTDTDTWNWQEDEDENQPDRSDRVVDVSFRLECQSLHVDHTAALHAAISDALPWFSEDPLSGLHLVYVAGSQNGWMRPEEPDELLHLSRRTRLTIRVALDRVEETLSLTGQVLDIAGNSMKIGEATKKPVMVNDILVSRHVIAHDDDDENEFLQTCAAQLKQMGIRFRKLLPGRQLNLRGPEGIVKTRSLMVADLELTDSLILQEQGLGEGRTFGCGLFIHQKGIKAINPDDMG
ncbi:MAG: type I-MYXAN CRISPR-associated protein Cas6/Cmx6 [Gammaproteobacteria bacterium]|nr:type I-MYXAN CRISPR-associated protein Cas6/Cmx6 [Gammaproteobacteria bacterium]